MRTTIIMPQLGESVAEGVIGKWLKQEGDQIEKDEPIVEVITDKVNAEIPSPVAGVLQKITQPEGATVEVGQEIAVIDEDSDGGQQVSLQSSETENGQKSTAAVGTPTSVAIENRPTTESERSNGRAERVRSSPLVRRLAEQNGVDLTEVPGTGIGGRVSKQDILSFLQQKEHAPAAVKETPHFAPGDTFERQEPPMVSAVQSAPAGKGSGQPVEGREPGPNEELIPVSPLRKMIAARMVLSRFTIPHAVTNAEVDMTNVVRYREGKKEEFRQRDGIPLSYVAFVIKATVEALKEFPMVNAEWAGDNIIVKRDININVAVDAPEGLTTPVIHHADDRSLAGISRAIYELAVRARNKKLTVSDMQGGTFTVNNTGALGSVSGVSIINYPQGGILSAAAIVKRPVVIEHNGQDLIAVRSMMNLGLSFDHRLLDGGYAASFVNSVKQKLEAWKPDYPLY